jgi:hypothetical protein
MSEHETWIDEQKKNHMFRGGGKGNDADRLLEISKTNRWLRGNQPQLLTTVRVMADVLNSTCLRELCEMVEDAQLCMDEDSRKNFMKVAIEQWQGKLANLKHKTIDILT